MEEIREDVIDIQLNPSDDEKKYTSTSKSINEYYMSVLSALSKPIKKEFNNSFEGFNKMIKSNIPPIVSEAISEKFKSIGEVLGDVFLQYIKEMPKLEIAFETQRGLKRVSFLMYALEKKWPIFLVEDDLFMDKILNTRSDNHKTVDEIVYAYFNEDCIDRMFNFWLSVKNINPDRIPLIKEAIDLYKKNYYYGATSIMMCQVDGLASDIFGVNIMINNNDEIVETIKKVYRSAQISGKSDEIKIKNVKEHEKLQLLWASGSVEHGILLWQIIAKYMAENVYASGNNVDYTNPCRNKICHGEQLNYGTREYALKSILIIDILFNLMNEHNFTDNSE